MPIRFLGFFFLNNLIGEIILVDQHAAHLICCIEYVYPFDNLWITTFIPQ